MNYSLTVHLPKTSFPMRADLPKREPLILDLWAKADVYRKMVEQRKSRPKFVLHDGPPYANGRIHMGHALNKILKDMVVKSKAMGGYSSPYVPGWDCHGLPIEHQLMKDLKATKHTVDRLQFRKQAADFARRFMQVQKEEFKRLGILGDWENPYLTLTPDYEAGILKVFRELFEGGYLYRSLKPVSWCASCETALAEAEVEYEDKESPAIFVKLKVAGGKYAGSYAVIWTTTPWTLPANVGLMLHPRLDYVLARVKPLEESWILAKALVPGLLEKRLGMSAADYEFSEEMKGEALAGLEAERIFPEPGKLRLSRAILSEGVSAEDGSGIVHTAPGHGEIDYVEGHLKNQLPVVSPVNDAGKFSEEVGRPDLQGLFVMSRGNEKVIEVLREKGLLAHQETIRHSYPHCWRCKNPILFRATHQWFLNVEHRGLRASLLDRIGQVRWVPAYGENRIRGMVAVRPDWCLSRQRLWGTPIPIFYCKACGEPLANAGAINMVEEKIGLEPDGSDAWFREPPGYFLDHVAPFKCERCGGGDFEKGNDILDVWFDSGASWESVLQGESKTVTGEPWRQALEWPAGMYLEGSDQHRGWFQSSLIPSVALRGKAPYREVLTHGFIVDGEGKKMSKSLGNVILPQDILKEYGADILRLWVASSDYREDIRISKDILRGVAENYRKIRNTFRYLIGNLSGFDPKGDSLAPAEMLEIDRWVLQRLDRTLAAARKAYDAYEFHRVAVAAVEFCAIDCSSFYFDVLKDRLYTFSLRSRERRSGQTALYHVLASLLKVLAPVLSFTCEEAWQLGRESGLWAEESVFLADFPDRVPEWRDDGLDGRWSRVLKLREKAQLSLESARQSGRIGSSLEAKVVFQGGEGAEKEVLKAFEKDLPAILIVSQIGLGNGSGPLSISVEKAAGAKCARCWRYDESVGRDAAHPEICLRCCANLA